MDTKNITDLLKYIFSPSGFFADMVEKVENLHFKTLKAMVFFIIIIAVASVFNIIGWMMVNIYLGLIVNILILIYFTKPKLLVNIGLIGALLPDQKPAVTGLIDLEKMYVNLVVKILLSTSVLFLFLGIIPIRSNANIVVIILFCVLLLTWIDLAWGIKTKTFRRATYILITVAVVSNFFLLFPRSTYLKYVGYYPLDFLKVTKAEEVLSRIEETQKEIIDKDNSAKLEKILDKVNAGKKLNGKEKDFIEKMKKSREKKIVPTKIITSISDFIELVLNNPDAQKKGGPGQVHTVPVFKKEFTDADITEPNDDGGWIKAIDWSKFDWSKVGPNSKLVIQGNIPPGCKQIYYFRGEKFNPSFVPTKNGIKSIPIERRPTDGDFLIWIQKGKGIKATVTLTSIIHQSPKTEILLSSLY